MADDIYDLVVGDRFLEDDGHGQTYVVVQIIGRSVVARCEQDGQETTFSYTEPAYAPKIVKLQPGESP